MRNRSKRIDRKLAVLGAAAIVAALALAACYPGGPEDFGDIGVVVTLNDTNADYAGLQTYAMEDTVLALTNPDDSSSEPLNRIYDPMIIAEIHAQMQARGFALTTRPDTLLPDVAIMLGATQNNAYILYQTWPYYPGYWPGYGWGGYPSTGAVVYKEGSIIWIMADLRDFEVGDEGAEPPVLWAAGINGALEGEGTNTEDGIITGIRQGFTQSPYIQASEVQE